MAKLELFVVLCVLADVVCSGASVHADCSPLEAADGRVSGYGLLRRLTQPCLYNVMAPPGPLNVSTRIYIYDSHAAENLLYDLHLLLQLEYHDPRLAYYSIAPNVYEISGGEDLQQMIWTPHVYLVNNQWSEVMGALRKDVMVTVYPDGKIIFAQRLRTTLTCWMRLHKFPFDEQRCSLVIENWIYSSELSLEWEDDSPVLVPAHVDLSDYYVSSMWTNTNKQREVYMARFHRHKQPIGSHSALTVTFHLRHQVGYYVMDYYMPSILLVITSWVAFWLDTDAVSGRIIIGISTILTFITLSCQTGSAMPTVSYVMASEVWFIACTAFIFGSLVEFAFVNIICRRRRHVELKKVTGKHILKSTLTPKLARKQIGGRTSAQTLLSGPSGTDSTTSSSSPSTSSVSQVPFRVPNLTQQQDDDDDDDELDQTQDFTNEDSNSDNSSGIMSDYNGENEGGTTITTENEGGTTFTTMSPQQIAKWIDKRSRVLFPVSFLVFNIVYWGFIFLDMAQKKLTEET